MAYHMLVYVVAFLPATILLYQLVPQKFRYIVLLCANCIFFCSFSKGLIIYLIAAILVAYFFARWIEKIGEKKSDGQKAVTKAKRKVLALGIVLNLLVLVVLKYTNFFAKSFIDLTNVFGSKWKFAPIRFLVPIGISFYTLEIISYLTDVYRGTIKAEHNFAKVALYLSFFPQTMEGPIARFSETADDLYAGRGITFNNLKFGYQRIAWGLFKKMVVADRFYYMVSYIFSNYQKLDGSIMLVGAMAYTAQLYMEFSGGMDIIIGSGQIFGITLPENFRQPFASKNASEFWRRWHITLGTFFKDYIFYPVSLAKPVKNFAKKVKNVFGRNVSKFVAPTVALFCVWICNGLWHGAQWTFIFYGMYYFVIIFIETITEAPVKKLTEKLHINRESNVYKAFQSVKLFFIVIIGEMFFRAESLKAGFIMFGKIFTDFHISYFWNHRFKLHLDAYDLIVALVGVLVVFIVGFIRERKPGLRERIDRKILPVRWIVWYACILTVIFFGAYGSGYSVVELIYAGY